MENKVLHNTMINEYNEQAFAHEYGFGFNSDGNVWCSITDSTILPFVTCLDRASRGAGYSLRFKPNKAQKELLKSKHTFVLCSVEYFNSLVATSKYNKGEIFEKLVTEYFGQTWVKDNVPFTDGPDLTVDGIGYQLKYEKATFTNEKALARLRAKA